MPLDPNWESSCRLCGEHTPEMLQIFGDEGKIRKIAHKLRLCLPVMVYGTDPLPKMICQFCAARLDDVFEFREYCIGIYRKMHEKMMERRDVDSVKIFLDAMANSPDLCQAQLCQLRSRAPPPLVPLPSATPLEPLTTPLELSELPCEVEINEDSVINEEISYNDTTRAEPKKTSILEQVLTGSLTINDCKELNPRPRLSSTWWCTLCNNYYRDKTALMRHMQLNCPRKYCCNKCESVFNSIEELAKHEGENHLKINMDFEEEMIQCQECDREFVSYGMLKNHRMRDHLAVDLAVGCDTWCSICNRFFPTIEAYKNHKLLHESLDTEENPLELTDDLENSKREHFIKSIRSLACPTCGKICTQQSALSNHMRTHEPKKYKCDECGRSFGLLIRLETHRLSEHNNKTSMLTAVEQEEVLNAEREAREAKIRNRSYDLIESEEIDEPPMKKINLNSKNVARCGICEQWFNDHTTMLNHLQTHSDNLTLKNFNCQICKKSFKEKWQLQRHEVSHKKSTKNPTKDDENNKKNVETTFHCQKCNKIFFNEFSLVTHQCMREKKFKCPKCLMFFGTSQARASHMRLHPSIKGIPLPPPEDYSNENFSISKPEEDTTPGTSSPLLLEPRIEIREEPLVPLKRTLIRTANGYRCGVCQSPFVLRELAVAHLRSAHPVMPYQCPYCKKRFTTQYTFTHHIKTDHPNESEK